MPDVHDQETRSYNMSKIKSRNTKPEIIVRRYLFSKGFRFRKNDKRYPGCPDIVLPKYRICIFVNGCFWHVHKGCKYFVWPGNNKEFWHKKLTENVERDKRHYQSLRNMGWKVIIIWECELKRANRDNTLSWLLKEIDRPS